MARWLCVLAVVLMSCSTSPPADTNALALKTGGDLLAVCSHQGERGEAATGMEMACIAYIASAVDSYSVTFCSPPETSTRGQARDLVVQYLRDHPQERSGRAIGEVWQALSREWPCPKPQPQPQRRR
jgi:Rap1a immunity proteins